MAAAGRWRRSLWLLLLAAVLLLHAAGVWWLDDALAAWGAGQPPMPPRIEAAFVRTLAPAEPTPLVAAAPPAATTRPARPRRAKAVAAAASAASTPAVVASAPVALAQAPPPVPEVPAPAPSAPEPAASQAPLAAVATQTAASAPAPGTFEWPPSTRLTYTLAGNYRGEVHGNARVQWVRQGERYQVQMDVSIGPSFAPLMARNMTSDGELGEAGLTPRRYDEVTKLPFQSPRRASVQFTPETVTLANGSARPALPGVQDTASQFVHLTWLFTTQPQLLRVGNSVAVPLALPRRLDRWVYDVAAEARLQTPVGALDTFHLKPRRVEDRPRGELSAEIWFAPALQYLPVRIRIQQDAQTFVDLMLDAAPLQAARETAPEIAPESAPR